MNPKMIFIGSKMDPEWTQMDPKCVMKNATVDTRLSEVHLLLLPRFVFSFSERGTRPKEAVGTVTAQHCGLLGCRVCV